MILHAGNGLVLTQSADIPMKQRIFRTHINLRDASEIEDWKEITEKQKEMMLAETAIIDVDNMTVESIKRVDDIINNVRTRIYEEPMTVDQSLELFGYYQKRKEVEHMAIGYKVSYEGSLFEVLQAHISQADWTPREAKSLFKVVQIEAVGTEDDTIAWEQGMVLEEGKFYIDNGVKYKCVRNSGNALWYSLDVLVGNYVEIVEE